MKPTIGRIVIYRLTDADKEYLRDAQANSIPVNVSEELPAVIVAVWSENCINVKVFVDGITNSIWKTSINEGTQPGMWM